MAVTWKPLKGKPGYFINNFGKVWKAPLTDAATEEMIRRFLNGEKSAALAKEFGVSDNYIQKIARGERKPAIRRKVLYSM